jgi:hypothetical protein
MPSCAAPLYVVPHKYECAAASRRPCTLLLQPTHPMQHHNCERRLIAHVRPAQPCYLSRSRADCCQRTDQGFEVLAICCCGCKLQYVCSAHCEQTDNHAHNKQIVRLSGAPVCLQCPLCEQTDNHAHNKQIVRLSGVRMPSKCQDPQDASNGTWQTFDDSKRDVHSSRETGDTRHAMLVTASWETATISSPI